MLNPPRWLRKAARAGLIATPNGGRKAEVNRAPGELLKIALPATASVLSSDQNSASIYLLLHYPDAPSVLLPALLWAAGLQRCTPALANTARRSVPPAIHPIVAQPAHWLRAVPWLSPDVPSGTTSRTIATCNQGAPGAFPRGSTSPLDCDSFPAADVVWSKYSNRLTTKDLR